MIDFPVISWIGVAVAAVAAFVFGAIYYTALGRPWMKAARIDPESTTMSAALFIVSFLGLLIMSAILALVIGAVAGSPAGMVASIQVALVLWVGVNLAPMAVNHRYQGFGWDLTVIDGIYWLGVFLVLAIVQSLFA
ncbi:MAG: DUF1761 domain-containing protein [Devosia sp.]